MGVLMAIKAAIDSSFLYSLFNTADRRHGLARNAMMRHDLRPLISDVVLGEASFLFHRLGGAP